MIEVCRKRFNGLEVLTKSRAAKYKVRLCHFRSRIEKRRPQTPTEYHKGRESYIEQISEPTYGTNYWSESEGSNWVLSLRMKLRNSHLLECTVCQN